MIFEKTKESEMEKCPYCGHTAAFHFQAEDTIGYWAFCVLVDCDCFIDHRKKIDAPPDDEV